MLYTDGLLERLAGMAPGSGSGTGLRDLRVCLHANRPLDAQGLMRAVIDRAMGAELGKGAALQDDVTVVVVEFLGARDRRRLSA